MSQTIQIIPKFEVNDSSFILLREIEEEEKSIEFSFIDPETSFFQFDQ